MSSEQQASAQAPVLCASGCGFYGNPATLDMCSVCYRQHCLLNNAAATSTKAVASSAASATATATATVVTGAAKPASCFAPSTVGAKGAAEAAGADASSSSKNPEAAVEKKAPANRCASCKKNG